MSRSRWLVGMFAMALCSTGLHTASAQQGAPRLPNSVTQASTVLGSEQQQRVDQYIEYWLDELVSSQSISEARDRLAEPFRFAGASDMFLTAYSAAMTKRLGAALKSESVLVRVNAMIIVEHITDENAITMVRSGLEDPNVAVRYRAVKAAGQIALKDQDAKKLNDNVKGALLKALLASLRAEQDFNVREQAMIAMPHLADLPSARTALLTEIDGRLNAQSRAVNVRTDAPLVGLRSLFQRLVRIAASGQAPEQEIRQLIPVAMRWLALSANILRAQKAAPGAEGQYAEMAKLCHTILDWSCNKHLAPDLAANAPTDVLDKIKDRHWRELHLKMEEWKAHVQKAPINVDRQAIAVPPIQ